MTAYIVDTVDKRFAVVLEQVVDNKASFKENSSMKCISASVIHHLYRLIVRILFHLGQVATGDCTL